MNKDTVNVKQYQIGNASCGNEQVDVKMCPFFFETAHSGRENVQNIKQLLITCTVYSQIQSFIKKRM